MLYSLAIASLVAAVASVGITYFVLKLRKKI